LEHEISVIGPTVKSGHVFRKHFAKGRNVLPGTCQLGQLTPQGRQQHVENGRNVRAAYGDFLPKSYVAEDFLLRSDDQPRTIISGQAFFDGLFSVKTERPFMSFLGLGEKEAPVQWNVMDKVKENMYPNFHVCPRLNRLVKAAKEGKAFKHHLKTVHDPLHERLATVMGAKTKKEKKKIKNTHVLDCLQTHICHGQPVPKALSSSNLLWELKREVNAHYSIVAESARRFAGGPFVKEILNSFQQIVAGSSQKKLALYSGHDTGPILPLLHAFGVADGTWPAYASMITMEIYEAKKKKVSGAPDHAVRMVYNGKVMKIPGCDGKALCPWDNFVEVAQAVIPKEGECDDEEMEDKLVHWVETFFTSEDVDIIGGDSPGPEMFTP